MWIRSNLSVSLKFVRDKESMRRAGKWGSLEGTPWLRWPH